MPKTYQQPLTTAQVAKRFGVNVKTVNRWAKNGELPYLTKLPGDTGAYLYDPREVEKFEKERAA